MMMFDDEKQLLDFVADAHKDWVIADGQIHFQEAKAKKTQEVPSMRLISETLSYATEIERII